MSERVIHVVLRPYPRCYVYVHFDPRKARPKCKDQIDHIVYVGKGTRERAWVDRRIYSPAHRLWLRDLQNEGFAPDEYVRIEFRKLTEQEALKLERQLAKAYRDKGVLLFNREKGYKGPVRAYENKWMPDPAFGKLRTTKQPTEGPRDQNAVMTEDRFKSTAQRDENEAESKYPPAKPGALRLLAPQRGLIATDQNQNRLVPTCDFILHALNGSEKTHCRKCQTLTATPAEPGELLKSLDMTFGRSNFGNLMPQPGISVIWYSCSQQVGPLRPVNR